MHLPTSYFTLLTLSLLLSSNLPQASGAVLRVRKAASDSSTSSASPSYSRAHPSATHSTHSHSNNHTNTHTHTHDASATPHASHIANVAQTQDEDNVSDDAGSEERPHRSLRWNRSASATWTGDWKTRTASRTWTGGWAGPTGRPSRGGSDSEQGSSTGEGDVVEDDGSEDLAKRSTRAPRRGRLLQSSHSSSAKPSKRSSDQQHQRSFALSRREPNFAETIGFNSRIARLMLQQRAKAIDIPKQKSSTVKARMQRRSSGKSHYVVSGAASKRDSGRRKRFSSMMARRAGNIADAQDLHADQVEDVGAKEDVVGMPGTIAIMSHMNNSTTGKKLASLYMDPSNSAPYILNASEKNATLLRLVPASSSSSTSSASSSSLSSTSSSSSSEIQDDPESPVTLQTTIDNASYCATYDPNPPAPEPLTMETCFRPEGTSDGASARKSQTFSFNKETGVIRPMWFVEGLSSVQEEDGGEAEGDDEDVETPGEGGDGDGDDDNIEADSALSSSSLAASMAASTTVSPSSSSFDAKPTAQGLAAQDSPSHEGAQNVTLVFVPSTETSGIDNNADDRERQSAKATQTVTVTAASSSSPSPSALNANTAAPTPDVSSSSAFPSSSSSASSSPTLKVEVFSQIPRETSSASGSASSSSMDQASATVMASASSVTTVTIPASSFEAAATASPSSVDDTSSSSTASVTAVEATATDSSPAPSMTSQAPAASSSVDAEAVASSIASSFSSSSESATPPSPSAATVTSTSTEGGGPSSTMVAVVARSAAGPAGKVRRTRMAAVDTEPYKWMFRAEEDR